MIVAEPGVTGAYGFQHVPAFYLPPVVTGSVILIIGIAVLPVAANDIVDGCTTLALRDPVLLENVAQAMGMLLLIVVIQRVLRGFLGTVVVLSGLVIGTSVA